MKKSLLACSQVSVNFGAYQALRDVSLEFEAGKVTALIGPNGAGKTTLLNVLSGQQAPTQGNVIFGGQNITRMAPWKRALSGMSRSFQIVNVFPSMTVIENVRLAVQRKALRHIVAWRSIDSFSALTKDVRAYLEEYGLADRSSDLAGELSHGEQRALEIALSMIGNPQILLLDEPLAGVGHANLNDFISLLMKVSNGRTTVLVEHNMDAVMGLADEIVCLVAGEVLVSGRPDQIRADERVREAYLGA